MSVKENFHPLCSLFCILMLNLLFLPIASAQGLFPGSGQTHSDGNSEVLGCSDWQNPSTSVKNRKEILQKIPFRSLTPYAQERVRQVLGNVSMYRRLPVQVIPCEKDLYDFMTNHPDTMVNIWELMKVSQMTLTELKPGTFFLEDQAGTQGKIECLYQTPEMMLIYVFGTYEGVPFPHKVSGCGLIILQNQTVQSVEGEKLLAIRLDAFMQIRNDGVEALAKTFQPLVGKIADHNLNQICGFLGELSRTTLSNGIGVANMARRLERVRPEVQREFAEVALMTSERASGLTAPMPLQYRPATTSVPNPAPSEMTQSPHPAIGSQVKTGETGMTAPTGTSE